MSNIVGVEPNRNSFKGKIRRLKRKSCKKNKCSKWKGGKCRCGKD